MAEIDWERVGKGVERENERMVWKPYGLPTVMDLERSAFHDQPISKPWDIPDEMAVSVAITGAFFRHEQNPHQPLTVQEIRDSAREVLLAGASTVHIHVRDDNGFNVLSLQRFRDVIAPLKEEFPDLAVDGCLVPALQGEWSEMQQVLESGLLDAAPVNATATYVGDSLFAKPAPILIEKTRMILDCGIVPEIALYTDADVSNAERFLFQSGLLKQGSVWLILPALPGCSPMANPRQMVEGLNRTVGAIRDVDPEAIITVCAAGRAAIYVAALASIMGLHIRVGMEDTYWLWPHRNDRISSNLQPYELSEQLASAIGRKIATRAEYRALIGVGETVSDRLTHQTVNDLLA